MSTQSFPPVSMLRVLGSFGLNLSVSAPGDCISTERLTKTVRDTLTQAGFTFVEEGEKSALLFAVISVMQTASYGNGDPAGFAYVMRLQVSTVVSGQPTSELFIVWQEFAFGSCTPLFLVKAVEEGFGKLVVSLAESLKNARK